MSSKISFFNKGLFFSNLKRFSWACILETIVVFFCFPFNLMMTNPTYTWLGRYSDILARNSEYTTLSNLTICVYAVVLAVLLFHYLHQIKMTTALHGLPVSRNVLFGSTVLSGAVLLLLPIVINVLFVFFVKATMEIGAWIVAKSVLRWAVYAIMLSLSIFAFATFVGMFVGNPAAQFVFTYILHFLPLAVFAGIMALSQMFLYGFSTDMDIPNWILELPMMTVVHDFTDPCGYYILLYFILAVVFFALALLAYKKRPLEQAGDVVVFDWVKPVFKYGVSLCFAVAGFLYIAAISNMETNDNLIGNTLLGALWGGVGFCIAHMLVAKTWRIFSAYKEIFGACLAVALVFVIFQSDVTGFERRVVAPEDVAYVELDGFYEFPESSIVLKEQQGIALVSELHRAEIERGGKTEEGDFVIYLRINYTLKDGSTVKRAYHAVESPELTAVYNNPEAIRAGHFMIYEAADRIESMYVYTDGEKYYINDREQLLAALREDVEAMQYTPWMGDYKSVSVNSQGVIATVEEKPVSHYNLEIELLPDEESNSYYYNGYRHYYGVLVEPEKMPRAYAVLAAQLPQLQPEE